MFGEITATLEMSPSMLNIGGEKASQGQKKKRKSKKKAHLSVGSLKSGKASVKIGEQMPRYLPLKRRQVVGSRKYRCREGVPEFISERDK
ncbi:hypothetical protein E2C01_086668 [Portunus trituberculatus]|uniref:Uncharacterized protein n=1 Tax=Portunus trituberculatus TaxID=210409 RepID=A0A5B7J9Y4_PORTR|nr:hypothetical protein [Portunus trituberculatus]